jgi:hypothetical protein
MDLETERIVPGLNKERNVWCFAFCCGSFVAHRCFFCGGILGAKCGRRRPVAIEEGAFAYLGWLPPPYWRKENSRDSVESRTTGLAQGARKRSSAMHDIRNSSHLKRNLCYLRNSPTLGVFAGHLYHG